MNFEKICVLGLGYIGLPTASMFAQAGLRVVGVDIKEDVITMLKRGELHIYEPGLEKVVRQATASQNLSFSTHPEEADAYIIAVPTPFYGEKKADMRFVMSAVEAITPFLRSGNLVILESTSPPRTTLGLSDFILQKTGLQAGKDFFLAYSPERVLPGQILQELVENARVIGGITPESALAGSNLYKAFVRGQIVLTDATTAEMVKLMENTYRDVNIAIANEFSRLADRFGVNVWQAIQIANLHPRVKILNPGPGVGGHCISVDPWFFVEAAPDLSQLIYMARKVNDTQPGFVLDGLKQCLGSLSGKKIAALGLAYKPDVDDLRESPAVETVHLLAKAGASVIAYEPFKLDGVEGVDSVPALDMAIANADAILILVAHSQFRSLLPDHVAKISSARIIFDSVNILAAEWHTSPDFSVYLLGNGSQWAK